MNAFDIEEFEQKIKYRFKDSDKLKLAFTHSSYANEHKKTVPENNERLEFLGDAVLDLAMADFLYKNHNDNEGEMTKVRSRYVCENALYEYSLALGLNKYIKVGHGEAVNGGVYKKAIVADIFESLMEHFSQIINLLYKKQYKLLKRAYIMS